MDQKEAVEQVKRDLRYLLSVRHMGCVPFQGGYVYPRNEIKIIIRDLRRYQVSLT
jgi:hypothetical protein